MEIIRYVLVGLDDEEQDHEFPSMREAIEAAGNDHAIVARTYVYDDHELVWTPDGTGTWPPSERVRSVRRGPLDAAVDMVAGDGFILPRAVAGARRVTDQEKADDAQAIREAAEELYDAYVGFYGDDDDGDMSKGECEMLRRAERALGRDVVACDEEHEE